MVRQMIMSAFSALGLQGNDLAFNFWLVDSDVSNHMTNSACMLKNVRKYHGPSQIQVSIGSNLPITKVGDITKTFNNIFVSPKLSTGLISVGQLVDNNCDVNFSRNGCLVQDQVSRTIIARGPKVGRLFPIHFFIPRVLSFACTSTVLHLVQLSMTGILQRYERHVEAAKEISPEIQVSELPKYSRFMTMGELLQATERQFEETNADGLTVTDLVHLENELQTTLIQTRSRKFCFMQTHLLLESVKDLHEQEKLLREENKLLEDNIAGMKKNRKVNEMSDLPPQRVTLNFLL
ncbi:agamous-like MADS-box protein AGL70 isoform X4 [Capsicum galapagoense]